MRSGSQSRILNSGFGIFRQIVFVLEISGKTQLSMPEIPNTFKEKVVHLKNSQMDLFVKTGNAELRERFGDCKVLLSSDLTSFDFKTSALCQYPFEVWQQRQNI